ncbi:hypothetical protein NM688_g7875 [Phlebia brevispora]|uniref:Uncharacterized protein n=1 Tax=Phlebia brevispora TaxID=194682 RepID=A0ACC1S087_9APHY|nr:hypothetical protein NM688_g7875 [Phlebia brevispora]
MGKGGLEVFKSRAVYYIWCHPSDGHPQWLGRRMYQVIPKKPTQLAEWVSKKQGELSAMLKQYNRLLPKWPRDEQVVNNRYVIITKAHPITLSFDERASYIYEIDLDHLIFSFRGLPLFHLDNVPLDMDVQRVLRLCKCTDTLHCSGTRHDFPARYAFNMKRLKAPGQFRGKGFATYERHFTAIVAAPHDILSLRGKLSHSEDVCLCALEHYVGGYTEGFLDVITQEIGLPHNPASIGPHGREIALTLACAALLPMHLVGIDSRELCRPHVALTGYKEDYWFVRKHICITLATLLHDERNAQSHISKLVDKVMSTPDVPSVVYGVVFSPFSCIVISCPRCLPALVVYPRDAVAHTVGSPSCLG